MQRLVDEAGDKCDFMGTAVEMPGEREPSEKKARPITIMKMCLKNGKGDEL